MEDKNTKNNYRGKEDGFKKFRRVSPADRNNKADNKGETDNKFQVPQGLKAKKFKNQGAPVGTRALADQTNVTTLDIPKAKKDEIRVLFFGGVGEIGKNMYAIEYNDEILILDCGILFAGDDYPGIDFVIPNIQYLLERKDKIKGMVISHGHLDHIGGISIFIEQLGFPTVYSRALTQKFILHRQKESGIAEEKMKTYEVDKDSQLEITKNFVLRFFSVTHTIPDAMGIIVKTPTGNVCFTGDLKLTHEDGVVSAKESKEFDIFGQEKILLTMADSTNAEKPGFSVSESKVVATISNIIKETNGRVILASFSSQLERNIKIIENAIKLGRKVAAIGTSMLNNLAIAAELGLLKVPLDEIIPIANIKDYPRDKVVVLSTGAQGEEYTGLDLMSRNEHRFIKLDEKDTIVFSSSVIPGNERVVQSLKDDLSRSGCSIITYETSDVHSSGHANREELKWIHSKINARFFTPIHGYHYMMTAHGRILRELGMPQENIIIPNNGSIVDITADGKKITHQKYTMPSAVNIVDGNAVGGVQELVIRDRKTLAESGIFVVIVIVNQRLKKIKKSPDIISRGFVYLKESPELITKSRLLVKRITEEKLQKSNTLNVEDLKNDIYKGLRKFFKDETRKSPVVVPVIFFS